MLISLIAIIPFILNSTWSFKIFILLNFFPSFLPSFGSRCLLSLLLYEGLNRVLPITHLLRISFPCLFHCPVHARTPLQKTFFSCILFHVGHYRLCSRQLAPCTMCSPRSPISSSTLCTAARIHYGMRSCK